MKTYMQSTKAQITKVNPQASVQARRREPPVVAFEDLRTQSLQQQAMQSMMSASPQQQVLQAQQAKMAASWQQGAAGKNKQSVTAWSDGEGGANSVVQRMPSGCYAAAVPSANGTFMDTSGTFLHAGVGGGATTAGRRVAVMRKPGNGGTPSVDPAGWNWLRQKFLRLKGDWVRFHLINAKLGGSGAAPLNLVPTTQALNLSAAWRTIEENAKVSASTRWTYLDVTPTYDNSYPSGIPRTIHAEWGNWDATNSCWVVRGTMPAIAQDNPADNLQPYGDATTLNRRTLKNLVISYMPKPRQRGVRKRKSVPLTSNKTIAKRTRVTVPPGYKLDDGLRLLQRRYFSGRDLDREWDIFLNRLSDGGRNTWYKIMNKVYLTEEGPAPWSLVYRK